MKTEQASPLSSPLFGRRVLVAVSGSIAAVKTPLLVSALIKAGAEVRCLVTTSGAALVSPVALASLSRHRCYLEADQWDSASSRPLHIELAEWAELAIVAHAERASARASGHSQPLSSSMPKAALTSTGGEPATMGALVVTVSECAPHHVCNKVSGVFRDMRFFRILALPGGGRHSCHACQGKGRLAGSRAPFAFS